LSIPILNLFTKIHGAILLLNLLGSHRLAWFPAGFGNGAAIFHPALATRPAPPMNQKRMVLA